MKNIKNIPLLCGVIDSAIVLVVVLLLAATEGKPPVTLMQESPGIVLGFLLPLCMVTVWRGTKHTKKLMSGYRGWLRPAIEGFAVGFVPIPFIQTIGILDEAIAAGPPWPSLSYAIEGEWAAYFLWLLQTSVLAGFVGVICGIALSGLNRILIHCWTANQEAAHRR